MHVNCNGMLWSITPKKNTMKLQIKDWIYFKISLKSLLKEFFIVHIIAWSNAWLSSRTSVRQIAFQQLHYKQNLIAKTN